MPEAFITGGSGFLGRNMIKFLVDRGWKVKALVRSKKAAAIVENLGATAITGDLKDIKAMQIGMSGCKAVFHSAAYVRDWGSYDDFYQDNVVGTENVLSAALAAKVPRFIHVGTEAVLVGGDPIINVDETRPKPLKPLGLYPITKGIAEDKVIKANSVQMATMVVRPRFIWGEDDSTILPRLVESVGKGQFSWVNGGKYLTSTCHVTNVCEGMFLASEKGKGGEIYFLTDGKPVEVKEFFTALLKTQGLEPPNKSIPKIVAQIVASAIEIIWRTFKVKGDPPVTKTAIKLMGEEVTVNDAKARKDLGYKGLVSVEEGLAKIKKYIT